MVFIDKWSLFEGYFVFIKEGLLKYGHYLQDGLYSVVFHTGLTVYSLIKESF